MESSIQSLYNIMTLTQTENKRYNYVLGTQPIYSQVDGYKDCFGRKNENSSTLAPADCLPVNKPKNCSKESWEDLMLLKENEILEVEQCHFMDGK